MKILKLCFVTLSLLMVLNTNAQKSGNKSKGNSDLSKFSISFGIGTASYLGDVIEKNRLFNRPSWAYSGGLSYDFTNHLSGKINFGVSKIRANDKDNKRADLKARGKDFKAKLFDWSIAGEYTIFDLDKHKVSPFVSAGVGAVFFYPYTFDITGKKIRLREMRTEGQAQPYEEAAWEFPLGVGAKYKVNDALTLKLEFNYRITSTDYLDDLSKAPRGNPKKNDAFYTTELKVAIKF
jgi:hypothetical protein